MYTGVKKGADLHMSPLQEQLLIVNLPLVHSIVQKKYRKKIGTFEYDDYFQSGAIGLCYAIKNTDFSRTPAEIKRYWVYQIIGVIQREQLSMWRCKKRQPPHGIISLNEIVSSSKSDEPTELGSLIEDQRSNTEREGIAAATIGSFIDRLKSEAPTAYEHYVVGKTLAQIGQENGGLSSAAINERQKSELARLRRLKAFDGLQEILREYIATMPASK